MRYIPVPDHNPLAGLLKQIDAAARAGFHLVAIGMAVALPDICVSLASSDGRSDGPRYKQWCTDYLAGPDKSFQGISPDDLYSFRCGMLHNGRFGELKHGIERIAFILPADYVFVDCLQEETYLYSVIQFCKNMCDAVSDWYLKHITDQTVQNHIPRMMRYHPGGIPGLEMPLIT